MRRFSFCTEVLESNSDKFYSHSQPLSTYAQLWTLSFCVAFRVWLKFNIADLWSPGHCGSPEIWHKPNPWLYRVIRLKKHQLSITRRNTKFEIREASPSKICSLISRKFRYRTFWRTCFVPLKSSVYVVKTIETFLAKKISVLIIHLQLYFLYLFYALFYICFTHSFWPYFVCYFVCSFSISLFPFVSLLFSYACARFPFHMFSSLLFSIFYFFNYFVIWLRLLEARS